MRRTYAEEATVLNKVLDETKAKIENNIKVYGDATTAINEKRDAQLAEVDLVKEYARDLDTLSGKEEKSAKDKEKMRYLVGQLNASIPNLNLSINGTTGALNMQTKEILSAIAAWETYINLLAAKDLAVEARKAKISTEKSMNDAANYKRMIDAGYSIVENAANNNDYSLLAGVDTNKIYQNKKTADQNYDNAFDLYNKAEADDAYYTGLAMKYQAQLPDGYGSNNKQGGANSYTPSGSSGGGSGKSKSDAEAEKAKREAEKAAKEREEARKKMVESWENFVDEIEADDVRWNDRLKKKGQLSDEEELFSLQNRSQRYSGYVDSLFMSDDELKSKVEEIKKQVSEMEGLTEEEQQQKIRELARDYVVISQMTGQERDDLRKKYSKLAEDAADDAFVKQKEIYTKEYEQRRELSDEWLDQMKEEGNYDKVIAGIERVKAYTLDYYEKGAMSAEEYDEAVKKLNEDIKGVNEMEFDAWLADADAYIEDNDFYDSWGDDDKRSTYERKLARIEAAHDAETISDKRYWQERKKVEKDIYSYDKEMKEKAIALAEDEFDRKMQAINDYYELRKDSVSKALEDEKKMLEAAADRELERIDELIDAQEKLTDAKIDAIDKELEARKRLREDEEQDDKIARIKKQIAATEAQIRYSRDEENTFELQRELIRQQEELKAALQDKEDTEFERQKADEKEQLKADLEAYKEQMEQEKERINEELQHKLTQAQIKANSQARKDASAQQNELVNLNNQYYTYDNKSSVYYDNRSGTVVIQGGEISQAQLLNAMNRAMGGK